MAPLNRGTPGYWVEGGRLELVPFRSLADYAGYREKALRRTGGDLSGSEFVEYEHSHCTELMREQGTHEFSYSLCAHAGRWQDSHVVSVGHSINAPLIAVRVAADAAGEAGAGLGLAAPPEFAVVAVKEAESGRGVVVRGYETTGRARTLHMDLPRWVTNVSRTDLLENEEQSLPITDGSIEIACAAHEIVTLLLCTG